MELAYKIAQNLMTEAIEMAILEFKRPICIAVCDEFGFLISFLRMEKAPIRSIEISIGKAYTAARMQMNTEVFYERLQKGHLLPSYFCDDKLTGLPGGSVLRDTSGTIIGAVGVSGLTAEEDQQIANMMASIFLKI